MRAKRQVERAVVEVVVVVVVVVVACREYRFGLVASF